MRHDGILHGSLRADEGRDIVRVVRRADAPWAIGSRFFHCSHRCTLYHPNLANVGSRVLSWLGILCLQGSAESGAAIGAVRTNASWLRHLHLPANFLPRDRVIQPVGNSCQPPLKVLRVRVDTLDYTLVSEDR